MVFRSLQLFVFNVIKWDCSVVGTKLVPHPARSDHWWTIGLLSFVERTTVANRLWKVNIGYQRMGSYSSEESDPMSELSVFVARFGFGHCSVEA
jgi:hypothetical protein